PSLHVLILQRRSLLLLKCLRRAPPIKAAQRPLDPALDLLLRHHNLARPLLVLGQQLEAAHALGDARVHDHGLREDLLGDLGGGSGVLGIVLLPNRLEPVLLLPRKLLLLLELWWLFGAAGGVGVGGKLLELAVGAEADG